MSTVIKVGNQDVDGAQKAKEWVANGLDQEAIKYAEEFGKQLAGKTHGNGSYSVLTTSQIRNFFGNVKKMQQATSLDKSNEFDLTEFLLLKPRLAYAIKRNSTDGGRDFAKVMQAAMDAVNSSKPNSNERINRFKNFAALLEAILAYHRAAGGK